MELILFGRLLDVTPRALHDATVPGLEVRRELFGHGSTSDNARPPGDLVCLIEVRASQPNSQMQQQHAC